MIQIQKQPGQRILELGGGHNRHPVSDVNVDIRSGDGVDFPVNFEEPDWPIQTEEFDGVISIFCLEHCSYRKVPTFLKEALRVIKPGAWALFVTPNTEEQLKWIQDHQEGWDGRTPFDSMSCILFGDQDYDANAHKSYWSPTLANKLFSEAGFVNIVIQPYGERSTDMMIQARKPEKPKAVASVPEPMAVATKSIRNLSTLATESKVPVAQVPQTQKEPIRPAKDIYTRDYFEHYQNGGFLWDFPSNQIICQNVLKRGPSSVLELGCARGYVLKRLQDHGLRVQGLDVSQHAWLTRVCDALNLHDLTLTPWPVGDKEFDLALSVCFLEHVPEEMVPDVVSELARTSTRGLHAVLGEGDLGKDPTRCTVRSLDWWRRLLPEGHEIVTYQELTAGDLDKSYVEGDGRIKLNLGCAWTMSPGWMNIDQIDAGGFANAFGYKFKQHDLKQGLPYSTGVVDLIFTSHALEHFTYEEGLRLLRECRRVIRPDGALRIVVPDCATLVNKYGFADNLSPFGEVNEGCAKAPTPAGKLWSLLGEGHKAFYDQETLSYQLHEAGWLPHPTTFRTTNVPAVNQILRETVELSYGFSLFMDAVPATGK